MTELPLVDDLQATAALHGSYCPKMCTFACPVTEATGRDDAVPWSFHRTVRDLVEGRLPPSPQAAARLTACSGCLACRVPCLFDQDVPAQVRAGRTALHRTGASPAAVAAAAGRVASGTSPYGDPPITPASGTRRGTGRRHHRGRGPRDDAGAAPGDATVVVAVGCRDDATTVEAALRLLAAAGQRPAVAVPDGCCGGALRDLGAAADADAAQGRFRAALGEAPERVVALDPHCLEELRGAVDEGTEVVHVVAELHRLVAAGRLRLEGAVGPVTYHDPCLLARGEGLTDEPRALLRAAGATLVEPEGWGTTTRCSGAGLGLELLDEDAAEATAARRRGTLAATRAPAVTACSGARTRLAAGGAPVADLVDLLARNLAEGPA